MGVWGENTRGVVVPKQTSSGAYLRGDLQMRRDAVMDDLGSSVPEVSVEIFFTNAAPQVTVDAAVVNAKLVHSGYITANRWAAFKTDPADANVHEDIAFDPLGQVIENIAECSGLDLSAKGLDFVQNPHQAPHSERSNTRPDSFFVRCSSNCETPGLSISEDKDINAKGRYFCLR